MTVDLTCRSCRGSGRTWFPNTTHRATDEERSCNACNGTGQLDHHQAALDVARNHGTRIAADWSGLAPATIVRLRKNHDGYERGRGRPSRAEMAAMAPRIDCTCPRCIDHRHELVRHLNRAGSTVTTTTAFDEWRDRAACQGVDPELFFPSSGEATAEAKAICRRCPVRTECLDAGIDERFGIWGGASERERRRMRRRRRQQHEHLEDTG